MSDLKFVYVSGKWISVDNPPENEPEKYYVASLHQTKMHFDMIPDYYWRYYNDRWEWYEDGIWHDDLNPLLRVTAYMEIGDIKPYEEGEQNE